MATELWSRLGADLVVAVGGSAADFLLLADALRALERLEQIRGVLATEGLTTEGSTGQQRSHPLLAVETGLRHYIFAALERLSLTPDRRQWPIVVGPDGRLKRRD